MSVKRTLITAGAVTGALVTVGGVAFAAGHHDFGLETQRELASESSELFGVKQPLAASSTESIDKAAAIADPTALATVAKGLKVRTVATVPTAPNLDQMAFWPSDAKPTHVIGCNEEGPTSVGLVAIDLATGASQTIVKSGLSGCDPVRRTAWGTIVFGEENGPAGRMFEIADPLAVVDAAITSTSTGSANIVQLRALGNLSYEGLALYPSGLLYYGDELRPGGGNAGGAYFKFVPTTPWDGSLKITSAADLAKSPLASGTVYGLQVGVRGSGDNGQGTEIGFGRWLKACDPTAACGSLTTVGRTLKLTGYYRPEDAEVDTAALTAGNVRICGNNTGNEGNGINGATWGNTICITDGTTAQAMANTAVPNVQFLVVSNAQMAMQDNLALQPGSGNWILHEDGDGANFGRNNDLWSCLDDGADDDTLADGCVRIASLNDLTAEWTGGFFDASGKTLYVSVQHNISGSGTLLAISGFRFDD